MTTSEIIKMIQEAVSDQLLETTSSGSSVVKKYGSVEAIPSSTHWGAGLGMLTQAIVGIQNLAVIVAFKVAGPTGPAAVGDTLKFMVVSD